MEKRSTERHMMEEFIHLDSGEGIIPAKTIDISRNGMKVVVNHPHSFDKTHRISVNLPGDGGEGIPCHIRRSRISADQWEIGLEFDGETDARMLLIERWLESLEGLKNRQSETDSAPTESRQIPRTRCTISDIECDVDRLRIFSIEDLSADGIRIKAEGEISDGELLNFTMKLPEARRRISFSGRVVYLVKEESDTNFSAGIAIEKMKETDRNRLRNFIVDIASGVAMLEYHKLLEREEPSEEFCMNRQESEEMIKLLLNKGITINHLDEVGLRILETQITDISSEYFLASVPEGHSETAFFSFTLNNSSFSFASRRSGWNKGIGTFTIPSVIYRGEKRSGHRKDENGHIELTLPSGRVSGRIIDSSRRGVLCEIPVNYFAGTRPAAGSAVEVSFNNKTIPGEIRHVVEEQNNEGITVFRIGLETGIRRCKPESTVYKSEDWKNSWKGKPFSLGSPSLVHPRKVSYTNSKGQKIAAFLHIINTEEPCTAVVIPPAFGKKKEAMAPLALTLMAHFSASGENLAVLRYDGIDRPGESDKFNINTRRGYEMIGYRIDQGYADLETTMSWVKHNDIFKAEKTVLISSSMAALDARRLQSGRSSLKADYWISLMGVSSAQAALTNILGGLDVIANYRMGIPIGTMGMLGQLIDMDVMASDMTKFGYATISDAREAMSRIDTPVTWIFGTHDKWMISDEILDIMSIAAPGDREIIEIPTAHNLRTSDDALSAFQMISDAILRRLKGKSTPPCSPDESELLDLLTRERERIMENEKLDSQRYWKGYLIGENDDEEGYDFYARLMEFDEFLRTEAELLAPCPGESIADLGCGTGLVSKAILEQLVKSNEKLEGTRFTAVDLVDEAIAKAEEKYLKLCRSHKNLEDVSVSWLVMDLEPDPLIPLRELIQTGNYNIEYLRDKIKNLKSDVVDSLSKLPDNIMKSILRGDQINSRLRKTLVSSLNQTSLLILEDLNRAARFIVGNIVEKDLKPSRRLEFRSINLERINQLRTSDLIFNVLDFGSWGMDGNLPIPDEEFDAISASLFLSYLYAPGVAVKEFARMLKPGGRLLLSSMKPDSDISGIFTRYIAEQTTLNENSAITEERERNLREARSMLNEAAALFSLEEDGWFQFFNEDQLCTMMKDAGFTDLKVYQSLGDPSQAIIITGRLKSV